MALEIKAISATNYPTLGTRETPRLCKLIDVSICIGCKACEVACQEWNDTPVAETYPYTGSYQTMPDLANNFWNLIKFREAERDGDLHWAMAKYQCMHCEDPGCLRACPAPGAIVQYTNGIVDFVQENCIGCQFCVIGCPFNVPRLSPRSQKVYKCTLCSDRVSAGLEPACIKACPTGCLQFGTKRQMLERAMKRVRELRAQGFSQALGDRKSVVFRCGLEAAWIKACPTGCLQFGTKRQMLERAMKRVRQLRAQGFSQALVYNPPGVMGTHAIYVLPYGNRPEDYGLPRDPSVPWVVSLWKGPLKTVGSALLIGGVLAAGLHYLKFGPQRVEKKPLVIERH